MNKTVKTIAWICLVLGLLGTAVDVGVYVRGQSLMAQFQEAFEAGEMPAFQGRFNNAEKDGGVDRDNLQENAPDRDGEIQRGGMLSGGRGFNTFSNNRSGFPGGMRDGSFGRGGFVLPFLFLLSGPVLAVVGAVMLIVNRTPKKEASNEKKEKNKKK